VLAALCVGIVRLSLRIVSSGTNYTNTFAAAGQQFPANI
jgi:hypothetical protein